MQLLSMYMTTLVDLLHDSTTLRTANSFSRSLQEHSIQRLTATGEKTVTCDSF